MLSGARILLRRHAVGITVALFLAGVLVAPRWWLLATQPPHGARVQVSTTAFVGDEAQEFSTIRQAFDGKLPVRDAWLVNHRNGALQAGAWWQEAIGVFGHVTGDPFSSLAVITTMMAVAGLLLCYVLAFQLTGSRWAAAAVLPVALLYIQVLNVADGFLPLRHWHELRPLLTVNPGLLAWPAPVGYLVWTRFLAPVLVLAPFFGAVIALPKAVESGSKRWIAVAAAALALLVYSYVFYWTATALAIAVWAAWLLYRRDFAAVRRLGVVCALAVLLALPELAIVAAKSLSTSAGVRDRVGIGTLGLDSGRFISILQRLVVALPFVYVLRRQPVRYGLYAGLTLAPLVLTGISGVMPQPWHYQTEVWGVFGLPAFIAGATEFARRIPRDYTALASRTLAVGAVIGVVFCAVWQVRATQYGNPTFAVSRDEYAALTWIRGHVSGNQTVVSPSVTTNYLLADLTPAAEYILDGYNPEASEQEAMDRFFRAQVAYGYGEALVFHRLDISVRQPANPSVDADGSPVQLPALIYHIYVWQFTPPAKITQELAGWRSHFEALQSRDDVLGAYPADYLYCGPRERLWPVEKPPTGITARLAFHRGNVTIYKLTRPNDPDGKPFTGCAAPTTTVP